MISYRCLFILVLTSSVLILLFIYLQLLGKFNLKWLLIHYKDFVFVFTRRPEIDVFETARNRNAVAVRRTPADRPNPQAVEDFNALKHKGV